MFGVCRFEEKNAADRHEHDQANGDVLFFVAFTVRFPATTPRSATGHIPCRITVPHLSSGPVVIVHTPLLLTSQPRPVTPCDALSPALSLPPQMNRPLTCPVHGPSHARRGRAGSGRLLMRRWQSVLWFSRPWNVPLCKHFRFRRISSSRGHSHRRLFSSRPAPPRCRLPSVLPGAARWRDSFPCWRFSHPQRRAAGTPAPRS